MTDFGILMFATDYAINPSTLAQEAEAHGFESIFFPEHTHIPVSRRSPWPGGSDLPKEYWHTLDPFVALTAAATVTTTLKLGTGISLVTERDPILMAKQVASLDHLSNGRMILGVGAGWNAEEMANHGTAFHERWRLLRERVLAMRALWTQEEAEFHGELVNFDKSWAYPKPVQAGGPPILLGASSKYAFPRIAEYGDGWLPIYQDPRQNPDRASVDYVAGIRATREAWAAAGRVGSPQTSIFGVGPDAQAVETLIAAGFDRVIFSLPPGDADTVLPLLEKYARIAHAFNSA